LIKNFKKTDKSSNVELVLLKPTFDEQFKKNELVIKCCARCI